MANPFLPGLTNQNESLILYKLVILYLLDRVNFPLTNSQMTEFIVSQNMASYFVVQQTISELTNTHLIKSDSVLHSTHFTITPVGEQTLAYYRHLIPEDVMTAIHTFLKENKIALKQQVSVIATYEPLPENEYQVHCQIKERNALLLEISVNAPDQELAEKMCHAWQNCHESLYSTIMTQLLQETDKEKKKTEE